MGAQVLPQATKNLQRSQLCIMAPMKAMKAMKASGKAMTKGQFTAALAAEHEMKNKEVAGIINSLVSVATAEVKKNGIFTIPGLCRIKTRKASHEGRQEDD